jgi:hypothetical protein
MGNYQNAANKAADYLGAAPGPRNTVATATLGPKMMSIQLATLVATVTRPLACMVNAPEVKNPLQNMVFKNIGRS